MIWCCFSHKSLQRCVLTGGVLSFPLTINIQPSHPSICRGPVHVAPYIYDLNYFELNYLSCRLWTHPRHRLGERRGRQPGAGRGRHGVALQEVPAGAITLGPREVFRRRAQGQEAQDRSVERSECDPAVGLSEGGTGSPEEPGAVRGEVNGSRRAMNSDSNTF